MLSKKNKMVLYPAQLEQPNLGFLAGVKMVVTYHKQALADILQRGAQSHGRQVVWLKGGKVADQLLTDGGNAADVALERCDLELGFAIQGKLGTFAGDDHVLQASSNIQ